MYMYMNLEIVREKGILKVYDLGYLISDEREEVLSVKYPVRGRTSQVNMIKYVISYIYDYKINPMKHELSKTKGKHTRAMDYIARNSFENMAESKKEKYLNKIISTKSDMNMLEFEIRNYKALIYSLYQMYPKEYSKKIYLERLKKQKLKLEDNLCAISNLIQNIEHSIEATD